MKRILLGISILLLITSCTEIPEKYSEILIISGENNKQIEKAIRYFERQNDQEKKDALYFLLSNMETKHSYKGKIVERYNELFYKGIDTLNYPEYEFEWKKIENRYGKINLKKLEKVNDLETITAKAIIDNIEIAFEYWRTEKWASHIDFKTFCESILPHRSYTEPLENWRPFLSEKYKGIKDTLTDKESTVEAITAINNEMKTWINHHNSYNKYPFGIKASDLLAGKTAVCRHKDNYIMNVCRSIGIPVVTHFTPFWADRDEGHTWCAAIKKDGSFFCFQGAEPILEKDSTKVPLPYKAAKIFQETYALNSNSLSLTNNGTEEIPTALDNKYLTDVTQYYPPSFDVSLQLPKIEGVNKKFAYLTVFNQPYWDPIFWGEVTDDKKVVFKNMKEDVLYLPVYYQKKGLIPVGYPFILSKDGNTTPIIADKMYSSTLKLKRKYPLKERIQNFEEDLIGGVFQGANSSDFSDADALLTITKAYDHDKIVNINNNNEFTYFRYLAPDSSFGNIAEIEVYGILEGVEQKLTGELIYNPEEGWESKVKKAFDGSLDSYYDFPKPNGAWIGLKFSTKVRITKIMFCPRSDTNFIIDGDLYELFFWDNGWRSLGQKKGSNHVLTYKNAPSKGLYWLRNLSGGKEERIFTYKNGKQVWW